ncbi:MAG TPA: universal stress protein [Streptosporangiaceae bacterium]|nr:universal stress protein [Streptosporangiaceae bacterium]
MPGIVVGIDGSHNASNALDWAMAEAAIRKAQLTVLTVLALPASYWSGRPAPLPGDDERVAEIRKSAEAAVEAAAAKLGSGRPESVTVTALSGYPAQALVDAAKDSDLLVVGARGGGGFGSLVLGSVSNQVVHHASCPVVVVPPSK